MATRTSRPGRTLIVFLLVIAGMFACRGGGRLRGSPSWGSTSRAAPRITLKARPPAAASVPVTSSTRPPASSAAASTASAWPSPRSAPRAATSSSSRSPARSTRSLERTIGSTAQLRFRLEALRYPPAGAVPRPHAPTDGATTGSETPSDSTPERTPTTTGPKQSPGSSDSTSKNRVSGRLVAGRQRQRPDPTEPTTDRGRFDHPERPEPPVRRPSWCRRTWSTSRTPTPGWPTRRRSGSSSCRRTSARARARPHTGPGRPSEPATPRL